ncbi:alpha-galactosidase [Sporolactobacillus vineae]|uniref:alpha-galactosidase n=1 Tax=Sporolactobacillus vineae TaxID=444463 RepID=UPI00028831F1|nr:alpha-galactosidase [Sporolactobacillus vineae]
MIQFDAASLQFHLQTPGSSYVIQVVNGYPLHLYWGKRIRIYRGSAPVRYAYRSFAPYADPKKPGFSPGTLPLEYPASGTGDYRHPAFHIQLDNGTTVSDLRYSGHRIYPGKKKLPGLPATYVESDQEAESLDLFLKDAVSGLSVILTYTVFRDFDVLTRSAVLKNNGAGPLRLQRALSASLDFRDDQFDSLTFYGSHNNERNINRHPLHEEIQLVDSKRGASSPQHDPFFALLRKNTDEDHGEVYGCSLVYSGNFAATIEVSEFHTVRASIGINPFDFSWLLEPGESFQTPEAVLVYSGHGLNRLSHTYHKLYRSRLARGRFRDQLRPILINNWEATYFKLSEERLLAIAGEAAKAGIELFVLDDGWFGRRDNDRSSLGDWIVDRRKLPHGLGWLAGKIHDLGLQFGLWFEPEMVSPDSDLYRTHPDWCLHVPGRTRSLSRNQLVLDLSRRDVRDYLVASVSAVLDSADINYVKWDMNRHMSEVGSALLPAGRQRETAHRYLLGLYAVLETLTSAYPEILFENCSSGGGRYDPGMLYYMPQTWASDNTDAISRLKIQYGTSLLYPPVTIGAHVSAVPNHQVGRITSLPLRGHVAMSGNFGYELDLTRLNDAEKKQACEQVAFYKKIRPLIQFGDFYRILNPFDEGDAAWCFVAPDRSEAIGFYFRILADASYRPRFFQFKGLDPDAPYENLANGETFGGDELMHAGVNVPNERGDFHSYIWRIRRK